MSSRYNRHWTDDEIRTCEELAALGWTSPAIARKLKRTDYAVRDLCKRHGFYRRAVAVRYSYQPSFIASQLGVSISRVFAWIRAGWLSAEHILPSRSKRVRFRHRIIVPTDRLEAFIADDQYWMLWRPGCATDPDIHTMITTHRTRPSPWLTVEDVAQRLHMAPPTVWTWVNKGILPSVVRSGVGRRRRWVHEEVLADFVPPFMRD